MIFSFFPDAFIYAGTSSTGSMTALSGNEESEINTAPAVVSNEAVKIRCCLASAPLEYNDSFNL
jgi:hypothetical protein